MNDLFRDLAPISDSAWKEIDDQARQALAVELAGRKLVYFVGPKGWQESAMNLGRVEAVKGAPAEGVTGALRQVQPLVELRAPFALSRTEMDNVARGAVAEPEVLAHHDPDRVQPVDQHGMDELVRPQSF